MNTNSYLPFVRFSHRLILCTITLFLLLSACSPMGVQLLSRNQPPVPSSQPQMGEKMNQALDTMNEVPTAQPLPQGSPATLFTEAQVLDEQDFIVWLFNDLDAHWRESFAYGGIEDQYQTPGLDLSNTLPASYECGEDPGGPVYCNGTIYMYMSWMNANAPVSQKDMAFAMVMAHEFGHHVQALVGILGHEQLMSIHWELQADCLAGGWAATTAHRQMLENGDYEEALELLSMIGDNPNIPVDDAQAHGSADLRKAWFEYGFTSGGGSACNAVYEEQEGQQEETTTDETTTDETTGSNGPWQQDESEPPMSEQAALQALEDYFATISDYNCPAYNDDFAETVATYYCDFPELGLVVQYDLWQTPEALNAFLDDLRSGYPDLAEGPVTVDDVDHRVTGTKLEYVDEQGHAGLFWTVTDQQMSGQIIANHADQKAIEDWWWEVGGVYFYDEADDTRTQEDTMDSTTSDGPAIDEQAALASLKNYFVVISEHNCEVDDDQADSTLGSFKCSIEEEGLMVRYDLWRSAEDLELHKDAFRELFPSLEEGVVTVNSSNDQEVGVIFEFFSNSDKAVLFWTEDARNMSGMIIADHAGQQAIRDWWAAEGSMYFVDGE